MPVINKQTIEEELKEMFGLAGHLNANFVLGYIKAYAKHVDKNIISYDVAYGSINHYVKSVELNYKNGVKKEIDLCP